MDDTAKFEGIEAVTGNMASVASIVKIRDIETKSGIKIRSSPIVPKGMILFISPQAVGLPFKDAVLTDSKFIQKLTDV